VTKNAPSRSPLRLGLRASALAAAGGLGFLVAAQPQAATADGLPLPTVSVPSLPTTVPTVTLPPVTLPITTTEPVTLPITTTEPVTLPITTGPGTTTTTATPTTVGTTSSAAAAGAPPATGTGSSGTPAGGKTPSAAETAVPGAVRLPNGAVSIPVTSVHLPARLVLIVTVTPRSLQSQTQAIKASIRVSDTRGFLVRGARVAVRSVPAGRLSSPAQKRSAADGRVSFVVRAKPAVLRMRGRLSLLVSAADPARPRTVAVSRVVAIPIRPRR
jgi:hypothetical protein